MAEPTAREVMAISQTGRNVWAVATDESKEYLRRVADRQVAALSDAGYSVVRVPSVTRLGRVVWETSRADEGTISVIGADHVAQAVLALFTEATDG